jgi:hypothetical protein
MPKSNNPNEVAAKFQFYVGELGQPLASAAQMNGRTLTEEIRVRLRQSLAAEGVDVDELRAKYSQQANPMVICAANYGDAVAYAESIQCENWKYARNPFAIARVRDCKCAVLSDFRRRCDASEILEILARRPGVTITEVAFEATY